MQTEGTLGVATFTYNGRTAEGAADRPDQEPAAIPQQETREEPIASPSRARDQPEISDSSDDNGGTRERESGEEVDMLSVWQEDITEPVELRMG